MPMTIRGLALAAMATTCFYGSVAAADTELTFRYAYDNVDEIQAGLDRFEELNPGITVTMSIEHLPVPRYIGKPIRTILQKRSIREIHLWKPSIAIYRLIG